MRNTLIPADKKILLHREYHERAIAVALMALTLSVVIGSAAVFPAFVKAWLAKREALSAVTAARSGEAQSSLTSALNELSADGSLVDTLYADAFAPSFSAAIGVIIAQKGPVSISSISIAMTATSSMAVVLNGTAPTRNDLIAFQSRLEGLAPGLAVNLPINELAKSVDIPFAIQVSGNLP